MTLFHRTERPLPAGKRPKVNASAEENSFVRLYDDEEEEIAFSMVASLRCGPDTVQSADTVEISPMEIPPIIPPAPSAARLLTRDWKSSVLEYAGDSEFSICCGCPMRNFDGRHAYCEDHLVFFFENPEFSSEHEFCSAYEQFEVLPPPPMTKEELKAEFPSYLNAWSTRITGFPSSALFTAFNDWLDSRGLSFEVLSTPIPPPCPRKPLRGPSSIARMMGGTGCTDHYYIPYDRCLGIGKYYFYNFVIRYD